VKEPASRSETGSGAGPLPVSLLVGTLGMCLLVNNVREEGSCGAERPAPKLALTRFTVGGQLEHAEKRGYPYPGVPPGYLPPC